MMLTMFLMMRRDSFLFAAPLEFHSRRTYVRHHTPGYLWCVLGGKDFYRRSLALSFVCSLADDRASELA